MKIKLTLLALMACLLSTGCSSYDHGTGVSLLGAGGAGALAYNLTEGKSKETQFLATGAAAAGTYAFGKYIQGNIQEEYAKKAEEGYRMGMADATKRQYQIIQNRQKEDAGAFTPIRYKIYEFPGVDHKNGVNYHPHNVKIRVQE